MMKKIFTLSLVVLCLLPGSQGISFAQKQPRTLTILYTNNINGEIEPCPT